MNEQKKPDERVFPEVSIVQFVEPASTAPEPNSFDPQLSHVSSPPENDSMVSGVERPINNSFFVVLI